MKFKCSMCDASGEISEDDLTRPVTRTACRECGTILMINPDTGRVDAHKSPLKDSPAFESSDRKSSAGSETVLSTRPQDKDSRDWVPIVVLAIVLMVLICAGIYFTVRLDIL